MKKLLGWANLIVAIVLVIITVYFLFEGRLDLLASALNLLIAAMSIISFRLCVMK